MDAKDILKFMQGGGDMSSVLGAMGGNMAALAPLMRGMNAKKRDEGAADAIRSGEAEDMTEYIYPPDLPKE